jgi:hypothetical protein
MNTTPAAASTLIKWWVGGWVHELLLMLVGALYAINCIVPACLQLKLQATETRQCLESFAFRDAGDRSLVCINYVCIFLVYIIGLWSQPSKLSSASGTRVIDS